MAYNATDYPLAISHAIVADTLAAIAGDLHYRGMANGLIAQAYRKLIDFDKELQYSERSLRFFKLANDSLRSRLALRNIALCYIEAGNPEKALKLLTDSTLSVSNQKIAECLLELNKIPDFLEYVQRHPELKTSAVLNGKYAIKMVKSGNFYKADSLIDVAYKQSSWHGDSSYTILAESELFQKTGQWEKLCHILIKENKRYADWLSKIYTQYDSQGQLQARDYISSLAAERNDRRRLTLILTIVGLIIILIIMSLAYLNRRAVHAKKLLDTELAIRNVLQENTAASERIHSLTRRVAQLQAELDSNRLSVAVPDIQPPLSADELNNLTSVVANIKDRLHALCDRHHHTASSDKEALDVILRDVKSILTLDTVLTLEQYVDALFGRLATRARRAGFSDKDIKLLSLVKLGFTNSEIALFTDTLYQTVAKRKSRLLSRLAEIGINASGENS